VRRAPGDLAPTFLTVLSALTLAACGQPLPSGTVVIAVERDLGALLPVIEQGSFDSEVNNLLYLGLNSQLWEDGALEYVVDELSLADNWEFGPDSLSLMYRIRSSAVWSDGQPITSADVVFTYELIRRPEIASPRIEFWENLDSLVAVDDHNVTFFFKRHYPGMLFHTGIGIIPAHVFDGHTADNATLANHPTLVQPDSQLVVSGPFSVEEWLRGEQLVLVPNPRAFIGNPSLERVVFRIVPEVTTRLVELENGSIDAINPAPVEAAARLAEDPRFRIESVTQRYYDYIAWNGVRYEPFTSPSVRLALSLAIDRDEVLAGLAIAPYAQPAAGPYPPIFRMLVDATLEPDPFLPDSARALLAAAGWSDSDGDGVLDRDGQPFEFTLLTQAGNERRTSAAQVVQAQLAAVGIDMQVQALDFGALLDILFATREFDAVLLGWQVGLEPDYVVGLFWPSDHTFNITGYASEAVDVAIDRAMSAASSSEAAAEWKAVARASADDHPYAFLWYFSELVGVNNRVQDTRINTYGVYQNLHRWRVGR
jgi:peptide/nickel transport system substrate-binding protein